MKKLVLMILMVLGCAGEAPAHLDTNPHVYNVAPELAAVGEQAMTKIRNASGIELRHSDTAATGIYPGTVEQMTGIDELTGKETVSCGRTYVTYLPDSLEIIDVQIQLLWPPSSSCREDVSRTLVHELIHSLRRDRELTRQTHSETGIFQAYYNVEDDKLDAASLTKLCEGADCAVFQPEE